MVAARRPIPQSVNAQKWHQSVWHRSAVQFDIDVLGSLHHGHHGFSPSLAPKPHLHRPDYRTGNGNPPGRKTQEPHPAIRKHPIHLFHREIPYRGTYRSRTHRFKRSHHRNQHDGTQHLCGLKELFLNKNIP